MLNYKLELTLLSDMCAADGGIYNSLIDTDVCKDSHGIPYIPAKRLKGCLRECALELRDWGDANIEIEKLFGTGGERNNAGAIRIGNAYPKGYEEYIKEIENGNGVLYHPQNVLNTFAYIRTQTAVNYESGVAKEGSLRTMRVVKKGLCLVSEVSIVAADENIEKKYVAMLDRICAIFRHMGLARTRGLGEIKAKLIGTDLKSEEQKREKNLADGDYLEYHVRLEEPMVCKSLNGGESRSLDYIEGSKIIGLFAECLENRDELPNILDEGDLVFTNGYIFKNSTRYTEVPGYIDSVKNDSGQYRNSLVFDANKEGVQLSAMKHCYVNIDGDELTRCNVEMEERYHHSRPEDKSYGRANDSAESKFYQISSIAAGQEFAGYIFGNRDQLQKVYNCLSRRDTCYMGYGKSAEYGKCIFTVKVHEGVKTKSVMADSFVVRLISPAICYSEKAMSSVDVRDLYAEILCALEANGAEINRNETVPFLKYTEIGGYNGRWNRRKPVLSAFDKGTAVKITLSKEISIVTGKSLFLGERNAEGYGEFVVEVMPKSSKGSVLSLRENQKCTNTVGMLGKSILERLIKQELTVKAGAVAKEMKPDGSWNATISNMIMMCRESKSIDEVEKAKTERYVKKTDSKNNKDSIANTILKKTRGAYAVLSGEVPGTGCEIDEYLQNPENQLFFLSQVLLELKYVLRGKKGDRQNEQ